MPKNPSKAAPTPSGKVVRWSIHILRKRAQWLGHVDAASQREALERAYAVFDIPERYRFRITAKRE